MGQTTSNMSIYIPAAGETNYDQSFAAGMINIDQHDHSGPPNKGVPLSSSGLASGSVTFDKLNANVVEAGEGLATSLLNPNALVADGILNSIYKLAPNGFIAKTAAGTASSLTFQDTTPFKWTNPSGVGGNPSVDFQPTFFASSTWTPTLISSGGGAAAYVTQAGYYFKIGTLVYVYAQVVYDFSMGSLNAGDIQIGGLPFKISNLANYIPCFFVDPGTGAGAGVPAGAGFGPIYARGTNNAFTLDMFKVTQANGTAATLTFADLTGGGGTQDGGLAISGMYLTV